jgi:hypothetical protein
MVGRKIEDPVLVGDDEMIPAEKPGWARACLASGE